MSTRSGELLDRARVGKRESKTLDFKETFDPSSLGEWCELLKDLVAMANSGGGVILIGAKNNGQPSGKSVQAVLSLDLADIGDKIFKYTGDNFSAVEVHELRRSGRMAALVVGAVTIPLVFTKAGTYEVSVAGSRPRTKVAFHEGVIYVRHGAKSEPATSKDVVELIERRVDELRDQWLGGIRKVVEAPADTNVAVYRPADRDEAGRPTRVRLTAEPGAPVFGKVDPRETHPHRQKELLREVNKRLPKRQAINAHDVLSVRKVHEIDETHAPHFTYEPQYGTQQYSNEFIEWLVDQRRKNPRFFREARNRYYKMTHTQS